MVGARFRSWSSSLLGVGQEGPWWRLAVVGVLGLALLAEAGGGDVVVEWWPNGQVKRTRTHSSDGGLQREVVFYATGARWAVRQRQRDGGLESTVYGLRGEVTETVPLDSDLLATGAFRAFQADGGVVRAGTYAHGIQHGAWQTRSPVTGGLASQAAYEHGVLVFERVWNEQQQVERELLDGGERREYERGQLVLRTTPSSVERWLADGGKLEESRLVDGGWRLLQAWTERGEHEVVNGEGVRTMTDGELGVPEPIRYRGGVPFK